MIKYHKNMFYIPIFHLSVDNWNIKKTNLMKILEESTIEKDSDDLHSSYYTEGEHGWNISKLKNISSILEDELKVFSQQFLFPSIQITSSWFEVAKKYECHGAHSHDSKGYVAVCYLQYDNTKHKPVTFIAPFKDFVTGCDLKYEVEDVEEGSIIFFPASIIHETKVNESNLDRIVVTLNMNVQQ